MPQGVVAVKRKGDIICALTSSRELWAGQRREISLHSHRSTARKELFAGVLRLPALATPASSSDRKVMNRVHLYRGPLSAATRDALPVPWTPWGRSSSCLTNRSLHASRRSFAKAPLRCFCEGLYGLAITGLKSSALKYPSN